jgi:hypothetical protein
VRKGEEISLRKKDEAEGFAESTSVLREKPDQDYGA